MESLKRIRRESERRKSAKEFCDVDERPDRCVVVGQSYRIRTPEELVRKCKISLDDWEVERKRVKSYEMGAKLPDGSIAIAPMLSIQVQLRRRNWKNRAIIDAIREIYATPPKLPEPPKRKRLRKSENLLEVSCPDLHIGKLAWAPETGEDYDVSIAVASFRLAVESLANRAEVFDVDRILFPIGNDYLNTDDGVSTTAGTPQDEDGRWQKTFRKGVEAALWGVDYLRAIAPVDVLVVPGNHDRKRMFYLGEVFAHHYRGCSGVQIFNDPGKRRYYEWGRVLLGFTHGNEEARKSLPLLMADEMREAWGRAEWCAWHLGHFHKRFKVEFPVVDSHRSVTVEVIPSLAGTDAYHHAKGYGGGRAAKAFVWNKRDGLQAEYVYHLRDRSCES